MYNRYRGNSGVFERVEDTLPSAPPPQTPPQPEAAPPPEASAPHTEAPPQTAGAPPISLANLSGDLARLLHRFSPKRLEAEDLLLLAILWLLWRESGDLEFLFALGALLLL